MPKKIAIMQPYFFPYIGYWQLINAVDIFVLYDDVNYIKGGWINRNDILVNGQKHMITLPLLNSSPYSPINKIKITDNQKIKEKLARSIEFAYKKAPYFTSVFPYIYETIIKNGIISDIVYETILWVKGYLSLNTEILLSSKIDKDLSLKGQNKVINIVKNLNGEIYINAIGGQELYSREYFAKENIELYFIKMHNIKYKQYNNEFVPNLSLIDVLMFNSPEEIKRMLNDYELI